MRIICDYCLTEYEVTPPPTSSGESRFSFRCSNCGRVFSAERSSEPEAADSEAQEAPSVLDSKPSEPSSESLGQDILIRQGDQTYSAGDQATVQKWIVERRISREGFICLDGNTWTPLHEVESLQPFLQLVEQVQALATATDPAKSEQTAVVEPTPQRSSFAEVAELESLVDVDPPDTQDELDIDPFPTEEVPLPEAPISANLRAMASVEEEVEPAPAFEAPRTEEVNFDYPIHDDSTLDSELIELPNEPELPKLEHAHPMIEVEAPGFAPHIDPTEAPELAASAPAATEEHALMDFPTEEELTLPEEDNDPLGNEAFASLDAWDDEDDDLAWVNDRKRGRRIAAALLLTVLLLLTTKLFLDRRADEPPVEGELETLALGALPEEAIEVIEVEEEAIEALPEDTSKAERQAKDESSASSPPAATPAPPSTPRRSRSASPDPEPTPNQSQLTQKAREAQTRRGPQPTTAADFVDRGRQAISEGNYNAARLYYLDAVDMEPQNAAANQGLAFAALQQGDTPFAIRHFCTTLSLTSPTSSMAQETRRALEDLNAECP